MLLTPRPLEDYISARIMGGRAMQKKHVLTWALLLILAPIVLPVAVVVLIALEGLVFGTRYFIDGMEAIGLTKVLESLFNALGING